LVFAARKLMRRSLQRDKKQPDRPKLTPSPKFVSFIPTAGLFFMETVKATPVPSLCQRQKSYSANIAFPKQVTALEIFKFFKFCLKNPVGRDTGKPTCW
jgi:hypothetical protein